MSIKLTDTQIVILSAAAQRDDRCLVAPRNLKGGAAQKVAAKLIDGGLAKEIKAKPGAPVWRQDEQAGQSFALKLRPQASGRSPSTTVRLQMTRGKNSGKACGRNTCRSKSSAHCCRSSCSGSPKPVRAPRRHELGAGPRI